MVDDSYILHAVLALSFLTHLASAAIAIWDRIRIKPSLIERLTGYCSIERFNLFEAYMRAELDKRATTTQLIREVETIDDRISGLHKSYRESQKTNEAIFRDLLRNR